MKKFFLLALTAIATGTIAFAGPSTKKVNDHFSAAFKNAQNVTWTTSGDYNQASFTLDAQKVNAYYNEEGELIGTTKNVAFDKLPGSALETITTKYTFPEYRLNGCIEFTDASNNSAYYVSFENNDETVVYEISKNGKMRYFATR